MTSMKSWEELLDEASDGWTCVEVLENFLKFIDAGDNPMVFQSIYRQELEPGILDKLVENFHAKLSYSGTSTLANWRIERSNGLGIIEAIRSTSQSFSFRADPQLRVVTLAHAAALAVDQAYGAVWIEAFREAYDSDVFKLEPGRIYPIGPPFGKYLLRNLYGRHSRLTPPLSTRNRNHRVLPHVALWAESDFHILIDMNLSGSGHDRRSQGFRELAEELARLELARKCQASIPRTSAESLLRSVGLPISRISWNEHWPRLATVLLNCWDEMRFSVVDRRGYPVIQNVHPGNASESHSYTKVGASDWRSVQMDRCIEALRLACEAKVDVLVFPELCLTRELQDELVNYAYNLVDEHCPQLVVFGSAHFLEVNGNEFKQLNVSRTVIRSGQFTIPTINHYKFNPLTGFRGKLKDSTAADEQLDTTLKQITLCVGYASSFLPLICKDGLHEGLASLWASLRPNLVLVPALSLVSGPFDDLATCAAVEGHCHAVVANGYVHADDVDDQKPDARRFGTFSLLGKNDSGAAGSVSEDRLSEMPQFPKLLILRWASEYEETVLKTGPQVEIFGGESKR